MKKRMLLLTLTAGLAGCMSAKKTSQSDLAQTLTTESQTLPSIPRDVAINLYNEIAKKQPRLIYNQGAGLTFTEIHTLRCTPYPSFNGKFLAHVEMYQHALETSPTIFSLDNVGICAFLQKRGTKIEVEFGRSSHYRIAKSLYIYKNPHSDSYTTSFRDTVEVGSGVMKLSRAAVQDFYQSEQCKEGLGTQYGWTKLCRRIFCNTKTNRAYIVEHNETEVKPLLVNGRHGGQNTCFNAKQAGAKPQIDAQGRSWLVLGGIEASSVGNDLSGFATLDASLSR